MQGLGDAKHVHSLVTWLLLTLPLLINYSSCWPQINRHSLPPLWCLEHQSLDGAYFPSFSWDLCLRAHFFYGPCTFLSIMLDESLAWFKLYFQGYLSKTLVLSLEKLQFFREHQETKWCKANRKDIGKYRFLLRYTAKTWMEHHNTEFYSRKFSRYGSLLDGSLIFPTYFRMELVSRIITNFKKHLNMHRKSGEPARKRSHQRTATFLHGMFRDAEVLEHGNKTSHVGHGS